MESLRTRWMGNQQVYCSSYKTKRNWGERSRDWGSCPLKSYDPLPSIWTWARARVYKSQGPDPHVIPGYYITANVSAHIYCCIWGSPADRGRKRTRFGLSMPHYMGFPGGSVGKESACNAGDLGLIPVSGRSPREGNGNPLQYFSLENPTDRGVWQATVHGVARVG